MSGTFQEMGASTVAPPKEDTGYPVMDKGVLPGGLICMSLVLMQLHKMTTSDGEMAHQSHSMTLSLTCPVLTIWFGHYQSSEDGHSGQSLPQKQLIRTAGNGFTTLHEFDANKIYQFTISSCTDVLI